MTKSTKTFFIETWGCQMNQHDSERLEGLLRAHGMRPAEAAASADLVLLNTCSVREKPVHKIMSRLGELERFSSRPAVGVCGCVAQQEGEAFLKRSKAVAFVLGPGQIERIGEAVRAFEQGRRSLLMGFEPAEAGYDYESIRRRPSPRSMITVIEGCDEFCTFCVVPYTRGREVSRPLSEVIEEAQRLAANGTLEVELLGQTINAYQCPVSGASFAELLDQVARIEGLERIRYVTSHPRHFSDELISVLSRHQKVSRYLHLPFQSGSDRILKKMHRRYTSGEYLELLSRLRHAVPDINLSTDAIVGFPGETEQDFAQTLDLLASVRFGQVFAFAFSPRPNTPARSYDEQVTEECKKERLQRLFALTTTITAEENRALVGSVVPVLVDGESRRRSEDWQGRGEDSRVVNFPKTGGEGIGAIVDVEITRSGAHSLYGRRIVSRSSSELPVLE